MRKNPHVRICGGPGSATTLVYPTSNHAETRAWSMTANRSSSEVERHDGPGLGPGLMSSSEVRRYQVGIHRSATVASGARGSRRDTPAAWALRLYDSFLWRADGIQ